MGVRCALPECRVWCVGFECRRAGRAGRRTTQLTGRDVQSPLARRRRAAARAVGSVGTSARPKPIS
eukprot:scaffold29832_cov112-Isochrysis_galbana.AAC.5